MKKHKNGEMKFREEMAKNLLDSFAFIESKKSEKTKTTDSCLTEINHFVSFLNHFTKYTYDFKFDTVGEKIHHGPDSYFFIDTKEEKPFFSTFQNASDQPLCFLLNYALYEYNIKYDCFSFFHIKLDQIANKTYNRESEHDYLKRTDPEAQAFVRDLCLKQQYILHYLSNLETCRIRLRGDSCVANINNVSFQLVWYFSHDRLVFTISFAVNNIFSNDYETENLTELLPILKLEVKKNVLKSLFSKEQSYFFYQYLAGHIHSFHLNEFTKLQYFIYKKTGLSPENQEKAYIKSFDTLLNTVFYLDGHEFKIFPPSSYNDDPSRFFFSNGNSIQIFS